MKLGMKRIATLCVTSVLLASGLAHAAGLDEISPDVAKRLYAPDVLDPAQPVGASAYRDWKPKKGPPWTIGYASSYAGNTWRAAAMDRLQSDIIPK
jgi:ribose transport system substrate-binding protein